MAKKRKKIYREYDESLTAQEYLEAHKGVLLEHALQQALEKENTPVLMKLLDKALPNLTKIENLNANIELTGQLLEDVMRNIGVIHTITPGHYAIDSSGYLALDANIKTQNTPQQDAEEV